MKNLKEKKHFLNDFITTKVQKIRWTVLRRAPDVIDEGDATDQY